YVSRGKNANAEGTAGYLAARLPSYMVPGAFGIVDDFPLTTSGKVDRRRLPLPGDDAYVRREYQAPEGEIERDLASIWQDLLEVGTVGRYDNFFELGGHSLHGVALAAKIEDTFGLTISVASVFKFPTISGMA